MAASFTLDHGSASVDSTFSLTWTFSTVTDFTAGSKAILTIAMMDTATPFTISTVTGGGLTWTLDAHGTNSDGESAYVISADVPTSLPNNTTITVVESSAGSVFTRRRWNLIEVANLATGAPASTQGVGTSGSSTTPSSGATTDSAASGDFAVACIGYKATSISSDWTVGSGYTKGTTLSANSRSGWSEYKVTGAGTVTGNATTSLTTAQWAAAVCFYKQADLGYGGPYISSESSASPYVLGYPTTLQNTPPPATANTFPGATAAAIKATASLATAPWYLDGGGVFRLPTFTPAQRLANPTAGDLTFDPSTDAKQIIVYDGSQYNAMPQNWWAAGGEGLREAMFAMAGTGVKIKAQNFPLWGIASASANESSLSMTNGRNIYVAIYWPGGNCTGIDYMMTTNGSYTDTAPHSGTQIMGGGALLPVNSGTTALTRITGTNNTTASNPTGGPFSNGAGHNVRNFSGGVVAMPAGIYYVNLFWTRTAVTTVPQYQGMTISGADLVNDNSHSTSLLTPVGFPMCMNTAGGSGDADISTTPITISTLGTTQTNVPWVGLH